MLLRPKTASHPRVDSRGRPLAPGALAVGALVVVVVGGGAVCTPPPPDAGPGDAGPLDVTLLVPDDVEGALTEVRDCRSSIEHELVFVRVLVDELAHGPYTTRDGGFPDDALVVKAEYDDDACGETRGYTVMKKLPDGSSPDALDWHWQEVDARKNVWADGALLRCARCHAGCDDEEGYQGTCAAP